MQVLNWSISIVKYRIFLYFLALISVISYATLRSDISVLFLVIFWIVITNILIKYLFVRVQYNKSKEVFLITFSIYLLYSVLAQLFYVSDPFTSFYYAQDSMGFYSRIYEFGQRSEIPNLDPFNLQSGIARSGTGIYYLGWVLSRISLFIYGTNSPLIHIMVVSWCAAMINVILYNSSRYFFNNKESLAIAITYGVFSYNLVYSPILLRDLHIALLLGVGFYFILGKFSYARVFTMLLLALITWMFRPAHGYFYIMLIFIYFYHANINMSSSSKIIYRFIGVVFLIIVAFSQVNQLSSEDYIIDRATGYSERSDERAGSSSGKSAIIYKAVPSQMFPFIRIIQTLWNPFGFPSYAIVSADYENSGEIQYLSFPKNIATLFWFVTMTILFIGLIQPKYRIYIPVNLLSVLILSLLLIVLAGFVINDIRRIIGGFPFIFLSSIYLLKLMPRKKQKNIINGSLAVFFFLALLPLLL